MNRLGELTEGDPRIEELSGLEGWFTLPEDVGLAKPPKYKMALATFLGVFPVAMTLNLTLGPAIRSWPFVVSSAVFNASVVILLTWLVMPLVTRVLHLGYSHKRAESGTSAFRRVLSCLQMQQVGCKAQQPPFCVLPFNGWLCLARPAVWRRLCLRKIMSMLI